MKITTSLFLPLTLALALLTAGCATLAEVKPLGQATAQDLPAIHYSLPRTVVTVALPIKRTVYKPSPLLSDNWAAYVDRLVQALGVQPEEVILPRPPEYSFVTKDLALASRAEPDPAATFIVRLAASGLQDVKLDLDLGETGQLQGAAATATNKAFEIGVKTAELALSVAKYAGMTAEIADPIIKDRLDRIEKLRQARHNLVTGGSLGYPAYDLKLVLENLQSAEKNLLDELLGTKVETVWTAQFAYPLAGTPPAAPVPLAKLDPLGGLELLAPADNAKLEPFGHDSKRIADGITQLDRLIGLTGAIKQNAQELKAALTAPLTLSLTVNKLATPYDTLPATADGGSFYYRVPGRAQLALQLDGGPKSRFLAETTLLVAQFGQVRQLPRKLGGTTNSLTLALHPETGAIKKLSTTTSAADVKGAIESVGAKAGGYLEARQKADDELAQLQREHAKLKLQTEIQAFNKTLNGP